MREQKLDPVRIDACGSFSQVGKALEPMRGSPVFNPDHRQAVVASPQVIMFIHQQFPPQFAVEIPELVHVFSLGILRLPANVITVIVIPGDGENPKRGLERLQDRQEIVAIGRAVIEHVSGKEYGVGMKGIDPVDGFSQSLTGTPTAKMDIRYLDDAQPVKGSRKIS